jgi:hypothetical protein
LVVDNPEADHETVKEKVEQQNGACVAMSKDVVEDV